MLSGKCEVSLSCVCSCSMPEVSRHMSRLQKGASVAQPQEAAQAGLCLAMVRLYLGAGRLADREAWYTKVKVVFCSFVQQYRRSLS